MRRKTSFWRWGLGLLVAGMLVGGAFSQNPSPGVPRPRAEKLMKDGNFREAYDGFKRLCLDPNGGAASQDLINAVQCLHHLGRLPEFDELIEGTIAAHKGDWRLLQTAARQYLEVPHEGYRVAGRFERGPHRGGGEAINSTERDRVRALQLVVKAMPQAQKDDRKAEVSQYF